MDSESTPKAKCGERNTNKERDGKVEHEQTVLANGLANAAKSLQQQVTVSSQTVPDLVQPTNRVKLSNQGEAHRQDATVECQDTPTCRQDANDHLVGLQRTSPASLGLLDQKVKVQNLVKAVRCLESLISPKTLTLQQGSSIPAFFANEKVTRRIENIAQCLHGGLPRATPR